jgi:hypothetical protein
MQHAHAEETPPTSKVAIRYNNPPKKMRHSDGSNSNQVSKPADALTERPATDPLLPSQPKPISRYIPPYKRVTYYSLTY